MELGFKIKKKDNRYLLNGNGRVVIIFFQGALAFGGVGLLLIMRSNLYISVSLFIFSMFFLTQFIGAIRADAIIYIEKKLIIKYPKPLFPLFTVSIFKDDIHKILIIDKKPEDVYSGSGFPLIRRIKDLDIVLVKKNKVQNLLLNLRLEGHKMYDYKYLREEKIKMKTFFEQFGIHVEMVKK
jgi:hypothetical protein